MAMANPANISNTIEPTVAKAKRATAVGRLSAGPSWRVAAATFAPNVRPAHAVSWLYLLRQQNLGANRWLLLARKTSSHLDIDRNRQPAVKCGRNKLAQRF